MNACVQKLVTRVGLTTKTPRHEAGEASAFAKNASTFGEPALDGMVDRARHPYLGIGKQVAEVVEISRLACEKAGKQGIFQLEPADLSRLAQKWGKYLSEGTDKAFTRITRIATNLERKGTKWMCWKGNGFQQEATLNNT